MYDFFGIYLFPGWPMHADMPCFGLHVQPGIAPLGEEP